MKRYSCDFETTTDENDCRVWASGIYDIDTEEFNHDNSIDKFINRIKKNNTSIYYFHNEKFDGEFIIHYLLENGYTHSTSRKLYTREFSTLITDMGVFYAIEICFFREGNKVKTAYIYDSMKLLNFSVEVIAKNFELPLSKLSIDYHKFRPIGYELDNDEIEYLKNDVTIVGKALKILFSMDLTKITIASNAFAFFKKQYGSKRFEKTFPPPYHYDEFIRKAYKGGFTYLNPKYADTVVFKGKVYDVNSLYPWVMRTKKLPFGEGVYYEGGYNSDSVYDLYVQRFKCIFELKKDFIPTIQLKKNLSFIPTEYVTSSNGEEVELTLTNIDLELFLEHYDVYCVNYLDGYKFMSSSKMFVEYIDYWFNVKVESEKNGNKALRAVAKLMLNSFYGKFGLTAEVGSKIPYLNDGIVKYRNTEKESRDIIYIPVATFVTSYAREKTIRTAQSQYDRFIYADTDSLHLEGWEIPDIDIHDSNIGAWKHENDFTRGKFLRAKTYIEEVNGKIHVTCAGMPSRCHSQVTFENFNVGMSYTGKLVPKHVKGGIILKDDVFTIREVRKKSA